MHTPHPTALFTWLTLSLAVVGLAAERPVLAAPPTVRLASDALSPSLPPPSPPADPSDRSDRSDLPLQNPIPPPVYVEGFPANDQEFGARAACPPRCVRLPTTPSNTRRYCGYYVGGGLPVHGEGRHLDRDGTWGWDYGGLLLSKRISLNWSHGQRTQGGTGAYKTDGPKLRHE